MGHRWLLRVSVSGARLTLDARPDARGQRRAWLRAGGFAWSHLELAVPERMREPLRSLAASLQVAAAAPPDVMLREASGSVDGLECAVLRRLPEAQPLPFWPVALRRGRPREGELWPFDSELVALEAGLRTLIRREGVDDAEAARERAYFEGHGLRTLHLGAPHGTLLAALDEATLSVAAERERANVASDESWAAAAQANGLALGYPPCCVQAFVQIRQRDELSLLAERLAPPGAPAQSPLTQWLDGALTLLSHAPCRADCAPSLALAQAALSELGPAFEQRWARLARRLHAIDLEGRCWALDVDDAGEVREALEVAPTSTHAPALRVESALEGARVAVEDGTLRVVGERGLESALFADHRG